MLDPLVLSPRQTEIRSLNLPHPSVWVMKNDSLHNMLSQIACQLIVGFTDSVKYMGTVFEEDKTLKPLDLIDLWTAQLVGAVLERLTQESPCSAMMFRLRLWSDRDPSGPMASQHVGVLARFESIWRYLAALAVISLE